MNTCSAMTFFGPCPFPPAGRAKAACVHEHIRTGDLCADHLAALEMADCKECMECAEPHNCPLTFVELEAIES